MQQAGLGRGGEVAEGGSASGHPKAWGSRVVHHLAREETGATHNPGRSPLASPFHNLFPSFVWGNGQKGWKLHQLSAS